MLKVLIAEEMDGDNLLEPTLNHCGYEVASLNLQGLDLVAVIDSIQPDIVILNVYSPSDAVLQSVVSINQKYAIPVIIFAEDQSTETINKVIKAGVSAYIVDGFITKRIKAIVDIAIARFNEQNTLKRELEKTRNKLEERKLVDKAKGILIKSQGCSEDEAYHTMRRLAMERNLSIGDIARNVISMASLLVSK